MKCMFCRKEFEAPEDMYASNVCHSCNQSMAGGIPIQASAVDSRMPDESDALPPVGAESDAPPVEYETWYVMTWKKFAVFNGRASRTEFWSFWLGNILIQLLLGALGIGPLTVLFSLAAAIPSIAVSVRRLHDSGLGGQLLVGLLALAILGAILLAPGLPGLRLSGAGEIVGLACYLLASVGWWYLMLRNSQPGQNQYGPNPYEADSTAITIEPTAK